MTSTSFLAPVAELIERVNHFGSALVNTWPINGESPDGVDSSKHALLRDFANDILKPLFDESEQDQFESSISLVRVEFSGSFDVIASMYADFWGDVFTNAGSTDFFRKACDELNAAWLSDVCQPLTWEVNKLQALLQSLSKELSPANVVSVRTNLTKQVDAKRFWELTQKEDRKPNETQYLLNFLNKSKTSGGPTGSVLLGRAILEVRKVDDRQSFETSLHDHSVEDWWNAIYRHQRIQERLAAADRVESLVDATLLKEELTEVLEQDALSNVESLREVAQRLRDIDLNADEHNEQLAKSQRLTGVVEAALQEARQEVERRRKAAEQAAREAKEETKSESAPKKRRRSNAPRKKKGS